jgi:hypothetical protein
MGADAAGSSEPITTRTINAAQTTRNNVLNPNSVLEIPSRMEIPMKVVILCGGQGTLIREDIGTRPKPLVEIGGRPGQLMAYRHEGFFAMDTYREYLHLNELWHSGKAPWRVWR